MKRILVFLSIAFMLACGATKEENGDLKALQQERDSLIKVQNEVEDRLAVINTKLGKLDTSKQLMQVTTVEVEQGTFRHFLEVYGNVEAARNVTLYPEMNGIIQQIHVKEGEKVSGGTLIATLDANVLQNNLKEVETSLELANTLYEKQKRLWDQNIGSEVEFLQAKNRKESLESSRQTLLSQIANAQIRAPFSGTIDEIFPREGEMASPMSPIARLVNLEDTYIKADVSEEHLRRIEKGSKAIVEIPTIDASMEARIDQVGSYINPNNRTFKVRINLEDENEQLRPNLLGRVKIKDFEVKDTAIVVPSRMIQQTPEGDDYVMLVKGSKVEKRMVQTGISYEGNTLIKSGLQAGERLIDKGARSVNAGQEVRIVS
jgi:RND family efflux transporter MFP subunit